MTEFFLKIVNMSIAASWIVLAVLLLRFVLKKAPKWITVLLWGIVAVRLICPFNFESVMSLIPSAETINPEVALNSPVIDSGVPIIDNAINPIIGGTTITPQPEKDLNLFQVIMPYLAGIWLVGVVAMLAYTVVSYLRVKRKIGTAVLLKDNIYQSESVVSPFVLGIVRPKIYLPFGMNEQDMEHVIAHEQAHIKRKDHWWKPLGFLILAIHWFNPLVWLGYVLLCRDIELACDEKVVRDFDKEQKADYSQALLTCSVNRRMIAACPLAFGEVGVKGRVKSVLNYKKPAFWIIVGAIVACVAVAVCFLTDPKDYPENSDGYYLTIGSDNVYSIEISIDNQSGGCVNANGSALKKGERIHIQTLDDFTDLKGVKITALGKDGEVIFCLSVPDEGITPVTNVAAEGWILAPRDYDVAKVGGVAGPQNVTTSPKCDPSALQEAKDAGYVVVEDGIATAGEQKWNDFFGLTQQGQDASIIFTL